MRLEAEASTADGALALLQQRLATVRSALQSLAVRELQVTSPSTWNRPAGRGRPKGAQASLRLSGNLEPDRFQALIRQVGALPGVRLSPVAPQQPIQPRTPPYAASCWRRPTGMPWTRPGCWGLPWVAPVWRPLEVRIQGGSHTPRSRCGPWPMPPQPPFDPAELPAPRQSLSLVARFCAQP